MVSPLFSFPIQNELNYIAVTSSIVMQHTNAIIVSRNIAENF